MGIGTGLVADASDQQARNDDTEKTHSVERETGIEPASLAWKARVLPLNYSRTPCKPGIGWQCFSLVEEGGFEPP